MKAMLAKMGLLNISKTSLSFIWALLSLILVICDARPQPETREVFFNRAEASRAVFPEIEEDSVVEIHYLEYILTTWVLEGKAWNAYHSGIGFIVYPPIAPDKQVKYNVEFVPRLTHVIRHVLVPKIEYGDTNSKWLPKATPKFVKNGIAYLTSDYMLEWENDGGVFFTRGWHSKYTNNTKIGETTGTVFNKMRKWFFEYQEKYKTFEPVEILDASSTTLLPSQLCHDLFYRALDAFHSFGFRPQPDTPIFRDHVLLFSSKIKDADVEKDKRAIIRFYRIYDSFMEVINEEFSNIRSLFMATYLLSVQPYIYKGSTYHEVEMQSPYINYCYMQVIMPPQKKAHFSKSPKLCALGSDISTEMTKTFLTHLKPIHALFVIETIVFMWSFWATIGALVIYRRVFRRPSNKGRKKGKSL